MKKRESQQIVCDEQNNPKIEIKFVSYLLYRPYLIVPKYQTVTFKENDNKAFQVERIGWNWNITSHLDLNHTGLLRHIF